MLPPDWLEVVCWLTFTASSAELPPVSNSIAPTDAASQSASIAINTAMPCFLLPAIFPKVQASENGMTSSR